MCVVFFGREYHDFLLCFGARTALSLFTVNDPCQLPSDMLNRHAYVRIRPIVRRIRNPQETRLSGTLTYVLATLQDIRTSFCALIRRRYIYEYVGRLQRRLRGAPLLFNEHYFYCGQKYFKLSVKLNVSSCFISLIQ